MSIQIQEHDRWVGVLADKDGEYLKKHFQPLVDICQLHQSHHWQIETKQYVGVIGLPSGA